MIGFELGGGALAGLCVVTVAVVIVAWLILRIVGRDHLIRVARIGVFVERQRVGDEPIVKPKLDTHRLDPEDKETRVDWPQREEETL